MVTARTVLLLGVLLAGCAREPAPVAVTAPDEAEARLAGVDWTQAEQVDVTLDEFAFAPEQLSFREGQPYRLHLTNAGGTAHTFTSPSLFSAVAVRPDGAVAQAASTGTIELGPGEAADLYFLPLKPGHYSYWCDEFLHSTFGMTGDATVQ